MNCPLLEELYLAPASLMTIYAPHSSGDRVASPSDRLVLSSEIALPRLRKLSICVHQSIALRTPQLHTLSLVGVDPPT